MISCIQPRMYGKSIALLKQARKEKDSVVMSFSNESARYLAETAKEIFSEEIDRLRSAPTYLVFKNGNTMQITGWELGKSDNRPKFIDELPYILEKLFGNIKMFTGTCQRMDLEPKHLPEGWVESRKMQMSEEQFKTEILGKFTEDGE